MLVRSVKAFEEESRAVKRGENMLVDGKVKLSIRGAEDG
jgi:hypothetical protein